jgi:nitrite reductase (NO-forming)
MVRRPIITIGYLLSLLNVAIGGVIGTLIVAGWLPALERLLALRAAHVWTNLAGFVSLVIIATLLHFLPTVLGTRIVLRAPAVVAVLATAFASPLIALGLGSEIRAIAGGGAVLALIGAGALVVEARQVRAARGAWTSDADWHFAASASLLAGVSWFAVGMTLASALVLARAAGLIGDDRVWSSSLVAGPLAIGWVVQVLVGSWTHMLPAIGPGTPVDHARQRYVLGMWAGPRVVALNAGTACVSIGWPLGISQLTGFGVLLVAVSVVSAAGLALAALGVARRR